MERSPRSSCSRVPSIGCKRGDAKKTTAENATPNAVASFSGSPAAGKAIDGEGFVGTPSPTVKGPVSFADAEAAFQVEELR